MACNPEMLKGIPLFALLDDDERAVLAEQVELKSFAARARIYKAGDTAPQAYVMVSGQARVFTVDEDQQEVVWTSRCKGSSSASPPCWNRRRIRPPQWRCEDSVCLEVSRNDIEVLLQRKPMAGMDLMTTLGHQLHAAHQLARLRVMRNPNEIIEQESHSARGSPIRWQVLADRGPSSFRSRIMLCVYAAINMMLGGKAWDPYPFILLNLFLSMLAAFQAPVIMMSQNRQDTKDRLRSELDFDVNRRSESEIQGLAKQLRLLDEKMDDAFELLRATGSKER